MSSDGRGVPKISNRPSILAATTACREAVDLLKSDDVEIGAPAAGAHLRRISQLPSSYRVFT
jgi:hypothetical protein